jgi:predicted nucleotidyltransferase
MSGLLRYNDNMKFLDTVESKDIALFCKRWKIREFAVFGSVLRDDFRPESDIDVLVTFDQSAEWSLFDHVQMRNELETLLGRKVDLVTRRALEQTQNHILRERILNSAKIIFSRDEAVYAER